MANVAQTTTHNYGSEQQWLITLSVPGSTHNTSVVFDKFTGGDVTASPIKYRPGGMGPEITYLSMPTITDITLTKVYETQGDHDRVSELHRFVGNTVATVTLQPLDDTGANWGNPRSYNGRIIAVKDGNADSMSNSARMYEVDISVETIGETYAAPAGTLNSGV